MEFRRVETRKIVRHQELLGDPEKIREVLEYLLSSGLRFKARISGIGGVLEQCSILSIRDDNSVSLFSNKPRKFATSPKFSEIESIEVESNCDFIAEERDEAGRWANIL